MSIPLTSDGRHFLPYTFSLNSLKLLANLSLLLIGPYIVCHMLIFGLITVARRRDYADQFKLEHKLLSEFGRGGSVFPKARGLHSRDGGGEQGMNNKQGRYQGKRE